MVLPSLGAIGGMVSAWLITNLSPAAGGAGITHIMGFLRHRSVPMGLRVGLVKLVAGIIAIGSGFPLGPEGPAVQMGGSVAVDVPLAAGTGGLSPGDCGRGGGCRCTVFSAPIGGFIAIEELLLRQGRGAAAGDHHHLLG